MTTIKELINFGTTDDIDAFLGKLPENLDAESAVYYLNKQYQAESTGVDNRYEFYTPSDSYVYDDDDDYSDYNGYDYDDDEDDEW